MNRILNIVILVITILNMKASEQSSKTSLLQSTTQFVNSAHNREVDETSSSSDFDISDFAIDEDQENISPSSGHTPPRLLALKSVLEIAADLHTAQLLKKKELCPKEKADADKKKADADAKHNTTMKFGAFPQLIFAPNAMQNIQAIEQRRQSQMKLAAEQEATAIQPKFKIIVTIAKKK